MKKYRVILIVLAVLLLAVQTASAAQQHISWTVKWGREDYPDSFWTRWSATATPNLVVRNSVYFKYTFPSGIELTLTENPLNRLYSASPSHMYSVKGFYLSVPGSTHAFAGTFWNGSACLPGPQITIEKSPERRIGVSNTTTMPLFLTIDDGKKFVEILPGESWERAVQWNGFAYLMVTPDMSSQKCADIRWDFTE